MYDSVNRNLLPKTNIIQQTYFLHLDFSEKMVLLLMALKLFKLHSKVEPLVVFIFHTDAAVYVAQSARQSICLHLFQQIQTVIIS